ncbi:MAG: hypothetical protein ACREQ7_12970 [Candidatus Binatia bacterium]
MIFKVRDSTPVPMLRSLQNFTDKDTSQQAYWRYGTRDVDEQYGPEEAEKIRRVG